ncbi:MAG TPA: SRPBCC domain-containing protein, partial [Streptosporangiaceae bacterium]|nr:SRPBCC domain-containing protein [Streptosporangiaceae bacterium]
MELEHSFTVPVPKERAWDVLLDVERVAPCMPGATLDSVDGDEIRGRIKVKVGPISMTYVGTAQIVERDEKAGIVRLDASGKETRGAGTASASVRSLLEDRGQETHVTVLTTLNVTGKPAQFGRGVMNEVGGKLIGIFANNLAAMLAQPQDEPTTEVAGETAAEAVGEQVPKAEAGRGEPALDDLDLTPRALASLRKAGIITVSQLAVMTDHDVLAIDGIGPASVDEIKARLAERGLALSEHGAAPAADTAPTAASAAASPASGASNTAASPSAANGAAGSSKAGANGARTGATSTTAPPKNTSGQAP